MKKIILLLLAVQMSVSAQVEKVWSVVIEDVGGGFDLATMRESMLVSSSGSVLLNVSRGLKEDSPFLAWISSAGKLIHVWKKNDESIPSTFAIVQFNDDFIATFSRPFNAGGLWIWEKKDGVIATKLFEENGELLGEGIWWSGNISAHEWKRGVTMIGERFFYGAKAIGNQLKRIDIVFSKYRLTTKSPTFWVQQSEDLETWKDVTEVRKGDTSKEFFRIAPRN